ncbi:MAG: hypothetical protein H7644_02055 [Candidatus Heimdallarchaeota archaeon]|nr:hypothetical protein [Candidatus Heimdallarchaeota archaeon]MCK5142528.1 hypothetical protein [Candidatus Heimdallarchaeota archaeon]
MVSRRIKSNSLALVSGSFFAFIAFYISSINYTSIYTPVWGGIAGSLIGGFICGIFIFKRDWILIGFSNIILILVFAIIAARFFFTNLLWDSVKYDPSLLLMVLGGVALLTALGTLLGTIVGYRIKNNLKSYFVKKGIISQDASPIKKNREYFHRNSGILFILGAAFFLFDSPSFFIFGDISAYIGSILILFAAVQLAISVKELASTTSGLEKIIKRTYILIISWGVFFAISRIFTTDAILYQINTYVILPFVILLALFQMVAFFSHYQVMKETKKAENLLDKLSLYFPLIYGFFAIFKVILFALMIVNLYPLPVYIFEITINYVESPLLIVLGTLFIFESKKQTPLSNEKN